MIKKGVLKNILAENQIKIWAMMGLLEIRSLLQLFFQSIKGTLLFSKTFF